VFFGFGELVRSHWLTDTYKFWFNLGCELLGWASSTALFSSSHARRDCLRWMQQLCGASQADGASGAITLT